MAEKNKIKPIFPPLNLFNHTLKKQIHPKNKWLFPDPKFLIIINPKPILQYNYNSK